MIESFPYQTVQRLRLQGWDIAAPEIVARTGWTTGELLLALEGYHLLPHYDLVTLLAGVNNQYRGLSVEAYEKEFHSLIKKSLTVASASRILVLSIPDWGVTPFASGRDSAQIAREIDMFNASARKLAVTSNIGFLDITPATRQAALEPTLVAEDGLHPSARLYSIWADGVAAFASK